MPVNRRYPIEALLAACADFALRTKRLITFEYTLIAELNDSAEQARSLAKRLRNLPARVNLIPLSPIAEFNGRPPPPAARRAFQGILEQAGINTTLRVSRGIGINAACGQLRLCARAQPQ